MKRMSALEGTHRRRLHEGAALSALAAVLWIPQAALIAVAIGALAGTDVGLPVGPAAAGVVALAVVRAVLEWIGGGRAFRAAGEVVSAARAQLARHVATRSPRDADRTQAGTLASLGAEKLDMLQPFLVRYSTARVRAAVMPLAVLVVVAWYSWAGALILVVAGPLIPVFMALIGIAAREAGRRQMAEIGQASGLFLDRLRGIVDIRVLGARERVAGEFEARAEGIRERTIKVLRIAFLSSAVLELLASLGIAMMAVYVGFSLLGTLSFGTWGEPLGLAQGLLMLMLVPEFFGPLRDYASAWHDRASAAAVHEEFDGETLRPVARILGDGRRAASSAAAPRIELHGVCAAEGSPRVDEVIEPGERIALMGASGAGKTTLLLALAGLIAPHAGSIRVAGRPLDGPGADAWRANLSWVGQQPHFVAGSIRANVALAGHGGDVQRIRDALALAAADGFVDRAPQGLQTPIGETGHGVSGGEGRRLAIARAAHARRPVVLADEPTADLDADTAQAVRRGLLALADAGATLIVATHDEALAAAMDRVIRLEAG